jgi:hypothetical protein
MKTLPVQIASANLSTLGERVRKVMCEIQFESTQSCTVDGFPVAFREFGSNLLNSTITNFTGQKRVRLSGWSRTPQITITNNEPLPMTILGLTTEIKFGTGKLQEAG